MYPHTCACGWCDVCAELSHTVARLPILNLNIAVNFLSSKSMLLKEEGT